MIFTKNYFGKEKIEEITYEDILKFFCEERQESDKIEFKSFVVSDKSDRKGDSLKDKENGIIKSISGFLNSEGGMLIWGSPAGEIVEGKKEKIFRGELSLVEHLYEKDQFISKLTDSITPTPRGILFHRIEHEGKYLYLFEAPKSEYSPHQFDNRFYMRIDGQTKPAPYHYIEALFKQIKFPNLNGYIKLYAWNLINTNQRSVYQLYFKVLLFNHSKLQNDYNVSYRILFSVGEFQDSNKMSAPKGVSFDLNGAEKRVDNIKDVIHYGEPVYQLECVLFDAHKLQQASGKIEIMLVFGAKKSPMKICNYKLQITEQPPTNLNDWFFEIKENEMMSEGNDVAEEDKLESILERKAKV